MNVVLKSKKTNFMNIFKMKSMGHCFLKMNYFNMKLNHMHMSRRVNFVPDIWQQQIRDVTLGGPKTDKLKGRTNQLQATKPSTM